MINTWLAIAGMVIGAIVWLVRLEGRINTIEAIVSRAETHFGRIEAKLDQLMAQRCLPLSQLAEWKDLDMDRRMRPTRR